MRVCTSLEAHWDDLASGGWDLSGQSSDGEARRGVGSPGLLKVGSSEVVRYTRQASRSWTHRCCVSGKEVWRRPSGDELISGPLERLEGRGAGRIEVRFAWRARAFGDAAARKARQSWGRESATRGGVPLRKLVRGRTLPWGAGRRRRGDCDGHALLVVCTARVARRGHVRRGLRLRKGAGTSAEARAARQGTSMGGSAALSRVRRG